MTRWLSSASCTSISEIRPGRLAYNEWVCLAGMISATDTRRAGGPPARRGSIPRGCLRDRPIEMRPAAPSARYASHEARIRRGPACDPSTRAFSCGASADPLRQLDDDPLRAADVAEPIDVFVVLHLANELRSACSQASDDGVDVVDCECEMADALGVRRCVTVAGPGSTGRGTSPAPAVRGCPESPTSRYQPGRPRAPPRGPPIRPRPASRLAPPVRARRRTPSQPRGRRPRCPRGPCVGSSSLDGSGTTRFQLGDHRDGPEQGFQSSWASVSCVRGQAPRHASATERESNCTRRRSRRPTRAPTNSAPRPCSQPSGVCRSCGRG